MNFSIERGSVLGVDRGLYDHYGVYVGGCEVIHFTSLESDISSNNSIMRTSIEKFIGNQKEFFILAFPNSYQVGRGAVIARNSMAGVGLNFGFSMADSE